MKNGIDKIIKVIIALFFISLVFRIIRALIPVVLFAIVALLVYKYLSGNKKKDDIYRNINYNPENYDMKYYTDDEKETVSRPSSVKDERFFSQAHNVKDADIIEE